MDIGKVIGKGGFCEVRFANLKHFSPRGVQNFGQDASGAQKYAMKYLSPKKTTASRVFQRGIADLAMEACFLSYLRHENVIGLHYVSEGSLEENYNCAPVASRGGRDEVMLDAQGNLQLRPTQPPTNPHVFGYFLLLDPLHESLADRIRRKDLRPTDGRQRSFRGSGYECRTIYGTFAFITPFMGLSTSEASFSGQSANVTLQSASMVALESLNR